MAQQDPLALLEGRDPGSFETLLWVLERLRGPGGCPWDRQQTHRSLKRNLLEEAYEVLEAIDREDSPGLAEELGDILLQVVFHIQMARERGQFTAREVLQQITLKLLRRHPHVFGHESASTAQEVEEHWARLKRQERGETSHVEDVPHALPALAYAQLVQERAAQAGFPWPESAEGQEQVVAQTQTLLAAREKGPGDEVLGELLFGLVALARGMGLHAEDALRQASGRFVRRFQEVERLSRERGVGLGDLSAEERRALWRQAGEVG